MQDITLSPGCDSCNSPQVLGAHFENNDDIRIGTPRGCSSSGAFTWTKFGASYSTSNKTDGTYCLYLADDSDYATIPTPDIRTAGTIIFDFYVPTWVNYMTVIQWYIAGSDRIFFELFTAGTAQFYYKGNNVAKSISVTDLPAAAAHTVTLKWSVAGVGGKYLSAKVDAWAAVEGADAITQLVGTWPLFSLGHNVNANSSIVSYIDNLKVYDSWQ